MNLNKSQTNILVVMVLVVIGIFGYFWSAQNSINAATYKEGPRKLLRSDDYWGNSYESDAPQRADFSKNKESSLQSNLTFFIAGESVTIILGFILLAVFADKKVVIKQTYDDEQRETVFRENKPKPQWNSTKQCPICREKNSSEFEICINCGHNF